MVNYYGWMSGIAYTLPLSLGSIWLSSRTKRFDRKQMLCLAVGVAGLSQVVPGLVLSFPLLFLMRMVHGFCYALMQPLLVTLVRDYFPMDKRGTANSILYSASFIGTAMSSLGIMLISQLGWKATYITMGAFGLLTAILTSVFVKDRSF